MLNIVIPNEHIVLEYEKLLRKIRDRILQDNDETARLKSIKQVVYGDGSVFILPDSFS